MLLTGLVGRVRARVAALLLATLVVTVALPAHAQIGSSRYAAIVVDATTGDELFAVNADEPRYPASLTKMMTLYMVFEALEHRRVSTTTRLRVSAHAAGQEPSKLGLRAGSTITVRDAIMALVTKSANDAAATIAENLGGSEVQFARMMTRRAQQLGMRNTSFRNASGLPHPQQFTTARDMATLGERLIRDFPQRYAYFSVRSFDWKGRDIPNHNRLLADYDGADGIKTGFINASGFNLVGSAARNGTRLVAAVFGGASGRERDEHMMALLDQGFATARRAPPTDMMMARAMPRLMPSAEAAPIAVPRPLTPVIARATPAPRATARAASRPAPTPRGGAWAVQVGAFESQGPALSAARSAARGKGTAEVERVKVAGRWYYRARVSDLSASVARQACRGRRGPCMVIPPG
jgi:D-alanyl-D-alanine carboxypeptidase